MKKNIRMLIGIASSENHGKIHLIERIDSRHGMHTLNHAEALAMGSSSMS